MRADGEWRQLAEQVGRDVTRFQELSDVVDTTAASILAVDRRGLPYLSGLLFGGPATTPELARMLHVAPATARDAVARLELAGFVRRQPDDRTRVDVTDHAREWIGRLWEPLRERGAELLARFSATELSVVVRFLALACELQESHVASLRRLLAEPGATQRGHRRGGLSPAALRNVQVFVEAHLARRLRTADLVARAGISVYHFGRAFRVSTGMTPRAYLEGRRVARVRHLLEHTDRPLAEIAAYTGFATQSQLTTAFRRLVGFTPAVYRREYHAARGGPQ